MKKILLMTICIALTFFLCSCDDFFRVTIYSEEQKQMYMDYYEEFNNVDDYWCTNFHLEYKDTNDENYIISYLYLEEKDGTISVRIKEGIESAPYASYTYKDNMVTIEELEYKNGKFTSLNSRQENMSEETFLSLYDNPSLSKFVFEFQKASYYMIDAGVLISTIYEHHFAFDDDYSVIINVNNREVKMENITCFFTEGDRNSFDFCNVLSLNCTIDGKEYRGSWRINKEFIYD